MGRRGLRMAADGVVRGGSIVSIVSFFSGMVPPLSSSDRTGPREGVRVERDVTNGDASVGGPPGPQAWFGKAGSDSGHATARARRARQSEMSTLRAGPDRNLSEFLAEEPQRIWVGRDDHE
jgi:hypothetical protein